MERGLGHDALDGGLTPGADFLGRRLLKFTSSSRSGSLCAPK